MFEKIDTILSTVDAVSGIEYTADNLYEEPTNFGAFIVDENVEVILDKLPTQGQIYETLMVADWYLHVRYNDYTKAEFKTLFDAVMTAIGGLVPATFDFIRMVDIRCLTPHQIGSEKCRTIFGSMQCSTRQTWV